MILAILVSIQHSRVPTFNLAKNSYFGLAAGKGSVRLGVIAHSLVAVALCWN
jgi:hypothetical protein